MGTYNIQLRGGMDAKATFSCGQAFRWRQDGDAFVGIAGGYKAQVTMNKDTLTIKTDGDENFWRHYFADELDYNALRNTFCEDERLAPCVQYSTGIRVLHQPFFETLCTFIISQNNNIPRITGIVSRLCEAFGDRLASGEYAFPTPQIMAQQTIESLAPLRSGFRAKYLLDAARKVASGEVSEQVLAQLTTEEARNKLISIYGVGVKVADCTLLYGLARNEVVPIDVHMRRAMAELFPTGLTEKTLPYAGIAQQYIFNYTRLKGTELKA